MGTDEMHRRIGELNSGYRNERIRVLFIIPVLDDWVQLKELLADLRERSSIVDIKVVVVAATSGQVFESSDVEETGSHFSVELIWQEKCYKRIYGAMNQALQRYKDYKYYDWITFWGADDRISHKASFATLVSASKNLRKPDLVVYSAQFNDRSKGCSGRTVNIGITEDNIMSGNGWRKLLKSGKCPAHQAVLFDPRLFERHGIYDEEIELAGDLEFLLRLSRDPGLIVSLMAERLVEIGKGGISSLLVKQKVKEVYNCYALEFGVIPWTFLLRYTRRVVESIRYRGSACFWG